MSRHASRHASRQGKGEQAAGAQRREARHRFLRACKKGGCPRSVHARAASHTQAACPATQGRHARTLSSPPKPVARTCADEEGEDVLLLRLERQVVGKHGAGVPDLRDRPGTPDAPQTIDQLQRLAGIRQPRRSMRSDPASMRICSLCPPARRHDQNATPSKARSAPKNREIGQAPDKRKASCSVSSTHAMPPKTQDCCPSSSER